jgi:hypothetical protein
MKKITIAVAMGLILSLSTHTASAETKSLVIIDSYFDSKVYSTNVKCVTLQNIACTDVITTKSTNISNAINHGNAMAEVAKKQNPNLPIILLRSATPNSRSVAEMNAGNFIDALRWVDANSSKIGAVSLSRFFNGRGTCSPATTNTASYGGVAMADKTIRLLIANLKNKGISVFASTGNTRGTKIDYPACITDTVSVSVGGFDGSGNVISSRAFDQTTDYVANFMVYNYSSSVFGLIPQTTSSATVAVAAQSLSFGTPSKVVQVLP